MSLPSLCDLRSLDRVQTSGQGSSRLLSVRERIQKMIWRRPDKAVLDEIIKMFTVEPSLLASHLTPSQVKKTVIGINTQFQETYKSFIQIMEEQSNAVFEALRPTGLQRPDNTVIILLPLPTAQEEIIDRLDDAVKWSNPEVTDCNIFFKSYDDDIESTLQTIATSISGVTRVILEFPNLSPEFLKAILGKVLPTIRYAESVTKIELRNTHTWFTRLGREIGDLLAEVLNETANVNPSVKEMQMFPLLTMHTAPWFVAALDKFEPERSEEDPITVTILQADLQEIEQINREITEDLLEKGIDLRAITNVNVNFAAA